MNEKELAKAKTNPETAFDDWVQSMADYRQQVEDDPNR
jgi:hypothetical protein